MAHPDSLLPIPTSKRKRLEDSNNDGTNKVPKARGSKSVPSKQSLRIVTDIAAVEVKSPALVELLSNADSDTDSLFDEPPPQLCTEDVDESLIILAPKVVDEPHPSSCDSSAIPAARRNAPPIPGLYSDPNILLPEDFGDELMWKCIRRFFQDGAGNQVMLFERAPSSQPSQDLSPPASDSLTKLPEFLSDLLCLLSDLLRSVVPPEVHDLLFSPSPASHSGPPRARQAIINLYWPGEGITPHVDLLDRYGDGIIGVSLGSGCTMQFAKVPLNKDLPPSPSSATAVRPDDSRDRCALYLPKGSVLVMTEEARYRWTHGIEKRFDDLVEESLGSTESVLLERDVRLSITFRWLLPGADVVGSALP